MPLISILIATHNRPDMLRECLTALSLQTFGDFEVWVVNDGGSPVSQVVGEFRVLDLHTIEGTENRGPGGTRNQALKRAHGEYIALCDDDDLFCPTHLARLIEKIEKIPLPDLVHSDAELVFFTSRKGRRYPGGRFPFALNMDREVLRFTNPVIPSTALYRKNLHDKIGLFDETIYHHWEWDWWLRVSAHGKIGRVPRASVLYGLDAGGGNISAAHEKMRASLDALQAKHGLGMLPTSNFYLMTRDPLLAPWREKTEIVWDGRPFFHAGQ